jgi:hypothetical protein
VDVDDGVGVIDGTGEHPTELRLAHARRQRGKPHLDVFYDALVVLARAELEQLARRSRRA